MNKNLNKDLFKFKIRTLNLRNVECTQFIFNQIPELEFIDPLTLHINYSAIAWINYVKNEKEERGIQVLFEEGGNLYKEYFMSSGRYHFFIEEVYHEDDEKQKRKDLWRKYDEIYKNILKLPQIYLID